MMVGTLNDLWAIMRKEWKEIVLRSGGRRGGPLMVLGLVVGVLGVLMPLQMGRRWVENPLQLGTWVTMSYFLVTSVIADSFAGERERHTLETLLATPLSDATILFGKVLSAISYGWGLALTSILVGLVTVNVRYGALGGGPLLMFAAPTLAAALVLTFLAAGLAAGAGVLISLRAATVRQAQQYLSFVMLFLVLVPTLGSQALPAAWRIALGRFLLVQNLSRLLVYLGVALTVIDAALLWIATARFQRRRLILD